MIKQVFVIGSPRSGTSVLGQALRVGAGYRGFNEGQVFDLLGTLLRNVHEHYAKVEAVRSNPAHMVSLVPKERIDAPLVSMARKLVREAFGTEPWADKTPGEMMIRATPHLAEVWPRSRFVLAKRRAIDNIQSRRRKYPEVPFEAHCRMWSSCMQAWLSVRPKLEGRYAEVDQLEIERDPSAVGLRLGALLQLDDEQIQASTRVMETSRPERTSALGSRVMGLADTGWSPDEIAKFTKICGPLMDRLGYSDTEAYFSGRVRRPSELQAPGRVSP